MAATGNFGNADYGIVGDFSIRGVAEGNSSTRFRMVFSRNSASATSRLLRGDRFDFSQAKH
ncbi:MAG: hypothetical protein U1E67_12980 [Hyphomicrobiales bacterium]